MNYNELSSEEKIWISENINLVRDLIKQQKIHNTSEIEINVTSPLFDAAKQLKSHLLKKKDKINQVVSERKQEIERLNSLLSNEVETRHTQDKFSYSRERLEELEGNNHDFHLNSTMHLDDINYKLDKIENSPEDLFLPIGTIVEFESVPAYYDVTRLGDDRKSYPIKGSVGVVVSISSRNDQAIGVALRDEFMDGNKYTFFPSNDRCITYRVDKTMLKVIGHCLLPDGKEYQGYGYHATHERDKPSLSSYNSETEMILEGAGYFWNIHDFKSDQGLELKLAVENLEEMPWITGPVDEYENTSTSPSF